MTRDRNFKRNVRQRARASGLRYTMALADRQLVDNQRLYYELRAPEYGDVSQSDRGGGGPRSDGRGGGMMSAGLVSEIVRRLRPAGDVLELACGAGGFTEHLVALGRSVTVVDASPTMLERNRNAVGPRQVTYIEADLFTWSPRSTYDFVFFSSWLSHVPFTQFDSFWDMVRRCLRPGGRVAFVDEDDRARGYDDLRIVDGTPVAARTLSDGRRYDIVKVFWQPHELEERLRGIGWEISVEPVGETYLVGHGHDAQPSGFDGGR